MLARSKPTLLNKGFLGFCFLIQVSEWLKVVLGETLVSWFEVNMRTVDILHKLSKDSEQRGQEIGLLVEDLKQKTDECKADGKITLRYLNPSHTQKQCFKLQTLHCLHQDKGVCKLSYIKLHPISILPNNCHHFYFPQ